MLLNTDSISKFAKVQHSPEGRLLGYAVMIPAEIVERYVDNSTETLNFNFIAVPEGILFEIGEQNMSVWDDVVPPYASLRDSTVVATFKSDEPLRTITNKYQQRQHDFAVTVGGSDYLLGVSNKTLMRMIKEHLPLTGKTLKIITRSGHGFETQYTVEKVQHKKHWQTKPLTCLYGMTRMALAFLWVLRKLLDWSQH